MMIKNKFIYLFFACVLLMSCNDNEAPVDNTKAYPLVVTGKAFGYTADGVGSIWSKGETIGVSMLKGGTNEIVAPYSNLRYYANDRTDQSYFLPGSNDSIAYFSSTDEVMDVAAYYPQATILADSLLTIHLIEAPALTSKLLFSRVTGLTKDSRKAQLQLRPALTKLTFKFKIGYGMTEADFKGLTVTLKGLPVSGYFNTLTGKVHFRDVSLNQEIKLTTVEKQKLTRAGDADDDKTFVTAEGMVLPSSTTEGYMVIVELPAAKKVYTYEIPKGTDNFEGSQNYEFDSEITNEEMIVKVQSSPIINWGEGGVIGGNGEENKK